MEGGPLPLEHTVLVCTVVIPGSNCVQCNCWADVARDIHPCGAASPRLLRAGHWCHSILDASRLDRDRRRENVHTRCRAGPGPDPIPSLARWLFWTSTPCAGFYEQFGSRMRNLSQGADTTVWLAAEEVDKLDDGAFYLDRKPATKHLPLAGTNYGAADLDKLWSTLQAMVDASA